MPDLDIFSRLAVALAIGLMVGIERGWKARDAGDNDRAAGLRTFGLSGLMGGVAGALSLPLGPSILAAALLSYAGALGAFTWLEAQRKGNLSATTLVAGLLTFLLGALATVGEPRAAIAAAVSMTVVLALRSQLHRWLAALTWPEIRAGLILLVMTFLLLPLLPDRPVDPWQAVNPHEVWLLAIMLALISFTGYIAVRIFGERMGVLVTAIAGGLASSTATTLTFARLGREQPQAVDLLAGGILISGAVMALRVLAIASALNPALGAPLAAALGAAALTLAASALLLVFGAGGALPGDRRARLTIGNPLEVGASLKLSAFVVAITMGSQLARTVWGDAGVLGLAALSGLADVDAITLSMARLDAATGLAAQAILLAVAVNTSSKACLAGWVGGRAIGLRTGLASALAVAAALLARYWAG
ncbi:MAG: DUF4010 domain-containing protein [Cereibacter changlensis]